MLAPEKQEGISSGANEAPSCDGHDGKTAGMSVDRCALGSGIGEGLSEDLDGVLGSGELHTDGLREAGELHTEGRPDELRGVSLGNSSPIKKCCAGEGRRSELKCCADDGLRSSSKNHCAKSC